MGQSAGSVALIIIAVVLGCCCSCCCLSFIGVVSTGATLAGYGHTATSALVTAYDHISKEAKEYQSQVSDHPYVLHRCEIQDITADENDPALDSYELNDNSITFPDGTTIDHLNIKVNGKSILAPIFEIKRVEFRHLDASDIFIDNQIDIPAYYLPTWNNINIKSDRLNQYIGETVDCHYWNSGTGTNNKFIFGDFQHDFSSQVEIQKKAVGELDDLFDQAESKLKLTKMGLIAGYILVLFGCVALGSRCFGKCCTGESSDKPSAAKIGGAFNGTAAPAAGPTTYTGLPNVQQQAPPPASMGGAPPPMGQPMFGGAPPPPNMGAVYGQQPMVSQPQQSTPMGGLYGQPAPMGMPQAPQMGMPQPGQVSSQAE